MSKNTQFTDAATGLRRRDMLLLGASLLSGCGGGAGGGAGSSLGSVLPGTGGTGIGVQGPITGFGSVIINGTRYDDRSATVRLNGQTSTSAALRIGMVAEVQGLRTSSTEGVAEQIDIWSVAQGPINQVDGVASMTLAGMTVHTNNSTSYEGCSNYAGLATALAAGAWATVWGVQASADGREWTASRIAVSSTALGNIVCSGVVRVSGGGANLNGWTLSGTGVASLSDRQLVRVEGQTSASPSTLNVTSLRVADASTTLNRSEAEVEGLVTAYTSNADFRIGSLPINGATASINPTGTTLSVGARLEVSGALVNGILVAQQIEVKDANPTASAGLDITGTIYDFNSIGEFEVRGQKCDASNNPTVSGGVLGDLANGRLVRLTGTTQGEETLLVSSLSFL